MNKKFNICQIYVLCMAFLFLLIFLILDITCIIEGYKLHSKEEIIGGYSLVIFILFILGVLILNIFNMKKLFNSFKKYLTSSRNKSHKEIEVSISVSYSSTQKVKIPYYIELDEGELAPGAYKYVKRHIKVPLNLEAFKDTKWVVDNLTIIKE